MYFSPNQLLDVSANTCIVKMYSNNIVMARQG